MKGGRMRARLRIDELLQEKSLQEGRRISVYAISKATGFSEQRIKFYIQDKNTRLDVYILAGLAQYFDCSVGDLFR